MEAVTGLVSRPPLASVSPLTLPTLRSIIRAFLPQRSGGGGRRRAAVHVQYGSSNKLE